MASQTSFSLLQSCSTSLCDQRKQDITFAQICTKTYPSRLNFDVSKEGGCPAGTLLINTSTLLAEDDNTFKLQSEIIIPVLTRLRVLIVNQANIINCRHCTSLQTLSVASWKIYTAWPSA